MHEKRKAPEELSESWLFRLLASLFVSFRNIREQYASLQQEYGSLVDQEAAANSELAMTKSELSRSMELLSQKKSEAESTNASLKKLGDRYELMTSVISARSRPGARATRFSEVLTERFLPFANAENLMRNEAEAILRLKSVEDELLLVESLQTFNSKSIVAVSGGFSSGKSSFITSLFSDSNIRLPIGVIPITAIPTYVYHAAGSRIVGFSKNGAEVGIPKEMFEQLSHDFVKEFGFNLRDLLPFITLETPMEKYQNLAFIDLPGYNPGNRDGHTGMDEGSAREFMCQAQNILWLIGLDVNGTISRADIDFLRDHVPQNCKLYVVLNKADLPPVSHVRDIMGEVEAMLDEDDVSYEGICAYDSYGELEMFSSKKSLEDVLREWDKSNDVYANLLRVVDEVCAEYRHEYDEEITRRKKMAKWLKALELNLFELGAFEVEAGGGDSFDASRYTKKGAVRKAGGSSFESVADDDEGDKRLDTISAVKQSFSELRADYDTKEIKELLDELNGIHAEFRAALLGQDMGL